MIAINNTDAPSFSKREGVVAMDLGFQPLGINIRGNTFTVADYFAPAFLIGELSVRNGWVHLGPVTRVAGTLPRRNNARMFPDVLPVMAVNRMQTVVIYNDTRLGLVRNSDCWIHDIVRDDNDAWAHVHRSVLMPYDGASVITSATLALNGFVTLEHNQQTGRCVIRDHRGAKPVEREVPEHRYGVAVRERDGAIFTIADSRAKEYGIFVGDKVQVPGITGNGIALVNDGRDGAFVTSHGYERGAPLGSPGQLLYVSPDLLE